jgi:hypothetical protein
MLSPVDESLLGRCSLSPARASTQHVEQLFVMATHARCTAGSGLAGCETNRDDARLLDAYARELRWQPTTATWMLVYREGYDRMTRVRVGRPQDWASACPSCVDGVAVWGEKVVWQMFPRLEEAVATHPHIREEQPYLRMYYWFHASLPVWFARYGSCYPKVRYIWRVESDVLWTGPIDQLISLASKDGADVLLPHAYLEEEVAYRYPHFARQNFLADVPAGNRVFALVCIGRYSRSFLLGTMVRRWERGVVGYEEILLPTTCLNSTGCKLSGFNGWENAAGNHVTFRVADKCVRNNCTGRFWDCEEYLHDRRLKNGTLDLWHPVKERGCLLDEIEAEQGVTSRSTASALGAQPETSDCSCAAPAPPVPPHAEAALRKRSVAWAERWRAKMDAIDVAREERAKARAEERAQSRAEQAGAAAVREQS